MGARRRWPAVAAALAWSLLAAALPAHAAGLELVGQEPLGGRGLNAGLALAGSCAYVGSRGAGPVAIVDVSEAARPRLAGELAGRAGATARELRALPDRHLLVVMSYALGSAGANRLDVYRWDADCAHPAAVGAFAFPAGRPHEFFLWRAAPGASRTLAFVSMFGTGGPDLRVIDLTDPSRPVEVGAWSAPAGPLHSVSVDADGRAYLALWTGGLAVADVADFTLGRPDPQVRLLTPAGGFLAPPPGGNVHSAVPVPGSSLLVTTDERYPPACPFGPGRVIDVADAARPRAVARLEAPENAPGACAGAPSGTYTSHNPTLTRGLAFVSWYSSGLQVFDLSDPSRPLRVAEYRAGSVRPQAVDGQLGSAGTMTWSYPVLREGLVYVADINQGLLVLRYSGPHEEELAGAGQVEGNVYAGRPAAVAGPSPTAAPEPSASAAPPRRSGGTGGGVERVAAAAAAAVLLLIVAVAAVRRRLF